MRGLVLNLDEAVAVGRGGVKANAALDAERDRRIRSRLRRNLFGGKCIASLFPRRFQGVDPEVATVWSYGLLGALHFVTLWWLREQKPTAETVVEQITALLWSGMGLD